MADLKISQFSNGSAIQATDEIATNRAGVNTKVFVGSAAAYDVGSGPSDIPTNSTIPTTIANTLFGTSTTENTIDIESAPKNFSTQPGKSFEVGRTLLIVDAADPENNRMSGVVTDYDSVTGDLDVDITHILGSGTIDDWIIYVSGENGINGWSPVFAIATDGGRRVLQIDDWVGGEGTKPPVGDYIGASGLTSDISLAVDIRGPTGSSGGDAVDIDYSNTASGLAAINVQDAIDAISFIPQNSKSADYTLLLTDGGKHIFHPSADTTNRTFTIPANSSVAYRVGTAITFVNQNGTGGVITIAITSDTMRLAGVGTTGNRSLARNGIATALKIDTTEWIISGTGLT